MKANSFTSGVSNSRKLIERERAILAHRHETQARAGSLRQELPRHEIAVVFHFGEQDHVSGPEKFSAPGLRDEVDAFRRPAGENDFVRTRRVEIARHALPCTFVGLGGARTQLVQTAMHIGVVVLVIMAGAHRGPHAVSVSSPRCRNRSAAGRAPLRRGSGSPCEPHSNRGSRERFRALPNLRCHWWCATLFARSCGLRSDVKCKAARHSDVSSKSVRRPGILREALSIPP